MQRVLLQRVDRLTPQDLQAVETGVSPQAVAVLKKVIPEIGFLLDMIGGQGGAPGGPPDNPAEEAAEPADNGEEEQEEAPPPPPGATPLKPAGEMQPASRLARV